MTGLHARPALAVRNPDDSSRRGEAGPDSGRAAGPATHPRAFYRGYVAERRRARQVRLLHIVREDGPRAGRSAYCSVAGYDVQLSRTIVLDPMPVKAPDGLTWCGHCVGDLARRMGAIDTVAAMLATLAVR